MKEQSGDLDTAMEGMPSPAEKLRLNTIFQKPPNTEEMAALFTKLALVGNQGK